MNKPEKKPKAIESLCKRYTQLIEDVIDTDEHIRKAVRGILSDKEIDGDSYDVPMIETIVDTLVKQYSEQKDEFLKVLEGLKLEEMNDMKPTDDKYKVYSCGDYVSLELNPLIVECINKRIDEAKAKFRLTTNNKGEKRCLKN